MHRTGNSLLLCYVGHHDEAYQWAERRKLETHPKTGAAQFVEIRERVQEITVPKYVEPNSEPKPSLFASLPDSELLGYGVPLSGCPMFGTQTKRPFWILPIIFRKRQRRRYSIWRQVHPAELHDQQCSPVPPAITACRVSAVLTDSFEHPDAKRRFRLINNLEELERALDYPWEKWTVFLHPAQRELVEREYNGPARVSGSAGTGKTIVAIHRVVYLARTNPDARLLLTTFSDPLSNALRTKLRLLIGNTPRLGERIEIHAMNSIGKRLYEANIGKPKFAGAETIRELIQQAAQETSENRFSLPFLFMEWEQSLIRGNWIPGNRTVT